jgi:trans-2,3-dihydro-3-hydroxyanthranilate isomerase
MQRRYVTVDVFSRQRFGGNPLAVIFEAQGLTSAQMQAIASEFNYSETTFVLPPTEAHHTARVRIFTPRAEVPFAGHPNVGTGYVIARQDSLELMPRDLIFEEAAGLVPIHISVDASGDIITELTAPEPLSRRSIVAVKDLAACLCLEMSDLQSNRAPQVISVGLPFLVAEVRSRDSLHRSKPNLTAFARVLPLDGADSIYVFTRGVGTEETSPDWSARMFAPFDGIVEDPATGSAAAALVALLASESPSEDADLRLRIEQGVDMGRPSLLFASARKRHGQLEAVRVGGYCVAVMEGTITVAEEL